MEDNRKLVIGIDLANVAFCGYYGEKLYNSKGDCVNMILTFFKRIAQIKDQMNPYRIVFAADMGRNLTFRRQIFKPYKAQRPPQEEDVFKQMKVIRQMVALLGYPMLADPLYEADDCLGMLGTLCERNNLLLTILSSDRDMYQLISDNVIILSPRKSVVTDMEAMRNEWRMTPQQWIELKMLQGDMSDNIPGVPGIGHKIATELLLKYHNIENLYRHLDELKPRIAQLLKDHREELPLMRQLVTILRDPSLINLTMDRIQRKEIHKKEIYDLIDEKEVPSLYNVMNYSLFLPEDTSREETKVHQHYEFTHF